MIVEIKEHGQANSYNKGCRCEICRKAKSDYRKNTPLKKHGTKWGYDKGCRCDICKKAKSIFWHKSHPDAKPPTTTNVKEGTRLCKRCNTRKPLDAFGLNKSRMLGRCYECRVCHNRRGKENKNTPTQRFSTYRWGANTRKISFRLSFEQFMLFWNKSCYYCGSDINGIGLDRKDPQGGYEIKNVIPCCCRCNRAKTIQTTEQFISMCQMVAERFKDCIVDPRN